MSHWHSCLDPQITYYFLSHRIALNLIAHTHMNKQLLELIPEEEIYNHLCDLYVVHQHRKDQHLGYVDKSTNFIEVSCGGSDLSIEQSISSLYSSRETSSTGFICWQTTSLLVDWLRMKMCPLYPMFNSSKLRNTVSVVELGTGVSGIIASVLGPSTKSYVCTDQKHILKLLKKNFAKNVVSNKFSSTTISNTGGVEGSECRIEVIELDWESPENGLHTYQQIVGHPPDLIIACDTVYNDFLIQPFLNCCASLLTPTNALLLSLQLRDEGVMEQFLQLVCDSGLLLYYVPPELLSQDLLHGFVVYYITK